MSAQAADLVRLRWRMLRSRPVRAGFLALAALVPLLGLGAVGTGLLLPPESSADVTLLAPTMYVSVAVLAVLAPLVAGGGNELFPEDQLVAFPIAARTRHVEALALTPLNLAWVAQAVGLLGVTAYITPNPRLVAAALVTCLGYLTLVTVAGQALAWVALGVWQSTAGRRATWLLAAVLAAGVGGVVLTGHVADTLDRSPTTYVVIAAINGGSGSWAPWATATLAMAALTAVAWRAGRAACSWALRRPGRVTGVLDSRPVARRRPSGSHRAQLLATDRASVWRSASLRRGLVVLGLLPGSVAAVAGLDWPSVVLLPGLVAAGAGLLFGVNVFCLDGQGATWLAAQPRVEPAQFWCKAQVILEVCAVAVSATLIAGSLRAGRWPTSGELTAVVACAVAVTGRVVATCMELSVARPHRADLRGSRDTPAPPGVMAAYSARLAVSTTFVGVLFSGTAHAPWGVSVLLALALLALSLRRLLALSRSWRDPVVRARVVATVTSG